MSDAKALSSAPLLRTQYGTEETLRVTFVSVSLVQLRIASENASTSSNNFNINVAIPAYSYTFATKDQLH